MLKFNGKEYEPLKDAIYGIVGFRCIANGEEIEEHDPGFKELLQQYEKENQ